MGVDINFYFTSPFFLGEFQSEGDILGFRALPLFTLAKAEAYLLDKDKTRGGLLLSGTAWYGVDYL